MALFNVEEGARCKHLITTIHEPLHDNSVLHMLHGVLRVIKLFSKRGPLKGTAWSSVISLNYKATIMFLMFPLDFLPSLKFW